MRTYLSSRFMKNMAVVTAALAVAGGTAGTAVADQSDCTGRSVVDRPGQHPVKDAPAHHGDITLSYDHPGTPLTVGQPWEFTLDEYNGTGADYQNIAVDLSILGWTEVSPGRLGGMTSQNTHLEALINGVWKNVPLQTGCDPALAINSTLVDHSLAAGARWKQTFRLTVDASVSPELTSFLFGDSVTADGKWQYLNSDGAAQAKYDIARPAATVPRPAAPATPAAAATPVAGVPTVAKTAAPASAVPTARTTPTAAASAPATEAPVTTTPAPTTAASAPATEAPVTTTPAPTTAASAPTAPASPAALRLAPVAASAPASGSGAAQGIVAGLIAAVGGVSSLVVVRARRRRRA
ncbi:hypothetical protein [Kitasatospora cathayae]|uniref:Gram-positive cocci surface proteins LPxTG domain-containing protein n=1 Tax=Kitasatospora cathayae TaxID=3004092 RepID=A0ABY7Q4X9_9ACTN|nr:hypothetical protein [Kitasatospora sp. HUAS 3-15]WBP87752.1 hypothetical protein O1G21_19135 [Kitasatospora sp. HUAS 3-15]